MAKKNNKEKKIKNNDAKGLKAELKKVSWPNAETLSKSTAAVLFLVITVAVIIFVSDAIFGLGSKKFSEYIVNKKGTPESTANVTSTTSEVENSSENSEAKDENKVEENKEEENKTESVEENKAEENKAEETAQQ